MDKTRNDDTLSERPTLGRTVTEKMDSEGPFLPWTDEDAERETIKHPDSPEEMTLAGRYKVLRRLGEGGMGSVWLAEDLKLDGRKVAIKMLPSLLAGKKAAYKQVKQEALMAMKLSHPNIATVRAFEEEDGNPFLVMDYIEGQGLDDILAEKGKLSEEETLRLLTPVAAALDYAHAQGVVHRDVKPGNIIIRKDGTPFVLDFGIAREIQETMTRVTGKFSSGTLLYMSPEQLRGRAPKAAQDVYSFAAVTYECLSGMPPFARGQVEYQIVNEPPEPLPEGTGSAALREGIMAGLAKNPEGRPRSCAEVLGLGEAAKRAREAQEAEEAKRRRQEAARLVQERARAEYEKRREEQALEAKRAARKAAEEKARKAREEARERALEAMQEKQARGRVAGWTWFLFVVLLVGGIAAYGLWQQEHETSQAKLQQLQQEAEAHRKAQQEAEANWKEATEAQRRAQEEAERKEEEAREKLERQRVEAEAQRRAQEEAEQKAAEARQELERQRAEAEAQRRAQEEAERKAAAEAEAKAEQERQMKPSILLKATVNGREVAATVTEGLARSGLQTPVTVNLEVGGSYSFAAKYEAEGKQFAGRTTVNAKDRGVTDAVLALEEVKEARAGEVFPLDLGNGVTLEMVYCPGVAADFWMGKYEVTQEQWQQVMGGNPSYFGNTPKNPVENVSWDDCQQFVRRVNALPDARSSGLVFRLPTEEEWETACRAGAPKSADYCKLVGGTQITEDSLSWVARYGNVYSNGEPVVVGSFMPNAWGLYDMHGNVWEWTETARGGFRVNCGGGFFSTARACTAGIRDKYYPNYTTMDLGLRLAASGRAAIW